MSRSICVLALGMACLAPHARSDDKGDKGDREALQGRWGMGGVTRFLDRKQQQSLLNLLQGCEPTYEGNFAATITLEVKDDSFGFSHSKDLTRKATATLDATKKPKAIELKDGGGKAYLGIYKLEGDSLTLCFGEKTRPTDFEEKPESILVQFKKLK